MKQILFLTLTLVSLATQPVLARDKTDVVELVNGDRITGEIKQLEHGILRLGTDSMGEVRIEWEDVVHVTSHYQFQFERANGERIVAHIQETDDAKNLMLTNAYETITFPRKKIVRIAPIEDSFWDRVKGSANFGYSFTKASAIAQLNFSARASHRTAIRAFSINTSAIQTSDKEGANTQRSDLNMAMTRFRSNRWFNSYLLGFESNDELALELRTSLGADIGRYLIQTNKSELSLVTGLIATTESLQGDKSAQQNIEGLLGMEFSRYIFNDPTVDISLKLTVFPSITDSGRTRAQFDANIRRELFSDLYWDLSFYETYDSKPPSTETTTKTDYGIVTSLGWSF